jgi:transcriptional regulator with XRE-family HTH domain
MGPQRPEPGDAGKKPTRQYGTVGYMMEQLVLSDLAVDQPGADPTEAKMAYDRGLSNLLLSTWPNYDLPFSITRLTEAPHGIRMDKPKDVKISYRVFTPPGHWGIHRYSLLRCTVRQCDAGQPARFMSHAGEELLYTEEKGLKYYFFDPHLGSADKELFVKPGIVYRIRPEIPHNNFYTEGEADCWMILRPLSGTYMTDTHPDFAGEEIEEHAATPPTRQKKTSRSQAAEAKEEPKEESRLFIHREELNGTREGASPYSAYAMIALGLRDKIRVARLRSGLSLNELAQLTSLNPSYLGRLEAGRANVSIENLARLARLIGIDLASLRDELRAKPYFAKYTDAKSEQHWLHPHLWDLRDGQKLELEFEDQPLMGDCSSWILAKGEVVFHYRPKSGERPRKEILAQDDVVHLRTLKKDEHGVSFTPIEDARLIEVRYSSRCSCGDPTHNIVKD